MDKYLRANWDSSRAPIVECTHYRTASTSVWYRLNLTSEGIELNAVQTNRQSFLSDSVAYIFSRKQKRDETEVIPWGHILGASVVRHDNSVEPSAMGIDLVVNGCIPKVYGSKRHQSTRSSDSGDKDSTDQSAPCERALVQWVFRWEGEAGVKKAPYMVSLIQTMADPRSFAETTVSQPRSLPLRRRHYLIYINPVGGAGRAEQTYRTIVAPLFQRSHIQCDVVMTEYQGHATDHAHELPLDTYDCVVAIGGDGLLSEILQGIMKRDDWKRAIRQPLGIIPGGSGNGLATSLLARHNEKPHAMNATYALVKGLAQDLDIATVLNGHQEVMYSFLSLEWAFIANIDIESEKYRRLFGGLRFTISALARVLGTQQEFTGKLRYLCSETDTTPPTKYHERAHGYEGEVAPVFDCFPSRPELVGAQPPIKGDWREIEGHFSMFWGMNVSHGSTDSHVIPGAAMDDGYFYLLCAPSRLSRLELTKLLLGLETGVHVDMDQVRVIRTRAFALHVDNTRDLICVDGELFKGPHVQVEVHRALGRIVCINILPPFSHTPLNILGETFHMRAWMRFTRQLSPSSASTRHLTGWAALPHLEGSMPSDRHRSIAPWSHF